jgi:hypothetical protein
MDTRLGSLRWTPRTPDWLVAAVSGFAAGAVLMVLDLLWSSIGAGKGPWQTSHMIASIFSGPFGLQSSDYGFSVGVVATALATHYALGIAFGLAMAAIMVPLSLDATTGRALLTGAVFGGALYLIVVDVVVRLLFPWLAELRGWETFAAHLVFGIVAALLYRKLRRTAMEP